MRRALSDPVRLRILESLWDRPKTAKALGSELGAVANRLYYHLRAMEEAGLIEVVGSEVAGRFAERIYGACFEGFGQALDGIPPEERGVLFRALFVATADEVTRVSTVPGAIQGIARGLLRTTPDRLARVVRDLNWLLEEARDAEDDPDAVDYRMAYGFFELVPVPVGAEDGHEDDGHLDLPH